MAKITQDEAKKEIMSIWDELPQGDKEPVTIFYSWLLQHRQDLLDFRTKPLADKYQIVKSWLCETQRIKP